MSSPTEEQSADELRRRIQDLMADLADTLGVDESVAETMRNLLESVTESLFEHAIRYLETSGQSRQSDDSSAAAVVIEPKHIMEGIGSCKDMRSGLFNIVSDSNLRDEFAVITKALGKVIKNLKSSGCQGTPEVHQHLEVESKLFAEAEAEEQLKSSGCPDESDSRKRRRPESDEQESDEQQSQIPLETPSKKFKELSVKDPKRKPPEYKLDSQMEVEEDSESDEGSQDENVPPKNYPN